jgi:amino acid transporter
VVVVTGFFALTSWMLISAYGASHAPGAAGKALAAGDSAGFVFAPIADQFGGWVSDVLPVLLATSLFAGILTFHNSANRYLFSLSRDGQLPAGLCRLNPRHSPWIAGCVQTLIAAVLVVPFALADKDPVLTLFSWFSGLAVLAMMLLYLLTSVSVVVYFRRRRTDSRTWNTLVAPVLGALGLAGAIWLILANFTTLIGGETSTAVWLVLTVPVVMALGVLNERIRRRRAAPLTH